MASKDVEMKSSENVEVRRTLEFYVFDNIAVFPIKMVDDYFPKFRIRVGNSGYDINHNNRIAFAAVVSNHLISSENFDNLQLFGVAIYNIQTLTIDHFVVENDSLIVKNRLLDVITHNIKDVYIDIDAQRTDIEFLIKRGFIEPKLRTTCDPKCKSRINMRYVPRPSTKLTLMQVKAIQTSLRYDVLKLQVFIPKIVATTLSRLISEVNEAAGNLSIVKYLEGGAALIGLSSENINMGTVGAVHIPEAYSPLVFHTHPDHVTREFKAFISWPSGQDMMTIAMSYLQFRNQLAHFVVSPEGLWVVHLTPEFQKLLVSLRTSNAYECSQAIMNAIFHVFTTFESPRLAANVEALDRHYTSLQYLETTKTYKLSNLVADVPSLGDSCKKEVSADSQLFDVDLIKWKRFSNPEEGVLLIFEYISDIPGGLSPFFFAF
jgi:hypothetical protein